jgi:hypothetical protein
MPTDGIRVAPDLVCNWLEWAGTRLLASPSTKIKPAGPKVIWPDYALDVYQVLDFRKGLAMRAPAPSASEIPVMEEILLLPNLCSEVRTRRVLHARCLLNPITLRHINSWQKIARDLHLDPTTARYKHKSGLVEVAEKINNATLARFAYFFGQPV